MTKRTIRTLVEDRDYWNKLCSELSDKNFELEENVEVSQGVLSEASTDVVFLKRENKRLHEAIHQALEKHKWNNEESAQILEKALEELK